MEIWKDIPGYEGRYQVSDLGNVRNGKRRVLKPQLINSGYHVVHLVPTPGTRKIALVHRLVAEVFVAGFFEGAHVNHKDCRKTNNRAGNLEWTTRSGNMRHSYANGHPGPTRCAVKGVSITDGHVVYFDSQLRAETTLAGNGSSAVHHCLIGKKKSAYGYTWSRA